MENQGRLLVVDDESANFDTAEILLYSEGYHLDYAANGLAALQYLEENSPDVILLDAMMPILDGLEVCRRVKLSPQWRYIPIIMVTALDSPEDMGRCLEAGADAFIKKPVVGAVLKGKVRSMIRIRRHYQALQASLQLREDMSNMLVHDLRNPLLAISLCCESLKSTNLQASQLMKVEQITLAGKQLQLQTDSLLWMAKLQTSQLPLRLEEIKLSHLCREVMVDFKLLADMKKVQLIGSYPDYETPVDVDQDLFRRVLGNLISNAIKFSPAQSQILICVQQVKGQTCLEVMDWGRGISPALRERVFERYETGEAMTDAATSSIGLGLAFCKMAIEAHGGKISVRENLPQGTVMSVQI